MLTKYYKDNKERLQIKACESHQNLSIEEKGKKQQYGFKCSRRNLPEDGKQKLVKYKKIYI